jgi:hypothetical protein
MKSSKTQFNEIYLEEMERISKEIRKMDGFDGLYGPHIPGVGDNYWSKDYKHKIAFIGKDVGEGTIIGSSLDDIQSFVKYSSTLMNEFDVFEWSTGQCTIGGMIINIVSELNMVDEQVVFDRKRDDLLASFVWAQVNCIWNYKAWKKKRDPNFKYEVWETLRDKCNSLNSLHLLLRATDFDIAILSCWDGVDEYLDLPYEVLISENHLRLLKLKDYNKFIVHTCHPTHWPNDIAKNPFYERLGKIVNLIRGINLS